MINELLVGILASGTYGALTKAAGGVIPARGDPLDVAVEHALVRTEKQFLERFAERYPVPADSFISSQAVWEAVLGSTLPHVRTLDTDAVRAAVPNDIPAPPEDELEFFVTAVTEEMYKERALASLLTVKANFATVIGGIDSVRTGLDRVLEATVAGRSTGPDGQAVAEALVARASTARTQLTPHVLPRIPRAFVTQDLVPLVTRALVDGTAAAFAVVGPAGSGKTTLLGQIFDELAEAPLAWRGVLLAADVLVGSEDTAETLSLTMGKAATGLLIPLPEVAAALVRERGAGVLLVDTVDLLLAEPREAAIRAVFDEVVQAGATLVFTCRDWEYDEFLAPARRDGSALMAGLQRRAVPPFDDGEVRSAAGLFLSSKPGRTEADATDFAARLLKLSADNRPLHEIVHSPLLLALLCELFGAEGTVPPDLTVTGLYDRYWNERVAVDRGNRRSKVSLRKEELCYVVAGKLFSASGSRLTESLDASALSLRDDTDVRAAHALQSEGIWREAGTSGRIRFFHQTFLEYAIARWLLRDENGTALESLLAGLREPGRHADNLHWWPAVRQLLVRADPPLFARIAAALDLQDIAAYRVLALAVLAVGDDTVPPELIALAVERSGPYRKTLLLALESGAVPASPGAWDAGLALLAASSAPPELTQAVETLGPLLGTADATLAAQLEAVISHVLGWRPPDGKVSAGQYPIVLGTFLREALPILRRGAGPLSLRVLRAHFRRFGLATKQFIIDLHLAAVVDPAGLRALLDLLLRDRPPQGADRSMTALLSAVRPWGDRVSDSPWKDWREALYADLPTDWDTVQARAAGCRAAVDAELLAGIAADLLHGRPEHMRRNLIALDTAVEHGAGNRVVAWLRENARDVPLDRCSPLCELVRASAPWLNDDERANTREWLLAAACEAAAVVPALAALGGPDAVKVCLERLDGLPQDTLKRAVVRAVQEAPLEVAEALLKRLRAEGLAGDPDVLVLGVGVDARRAGAGDSDALARIVAAAGSRAQRVARAAADAVMTLAPSLSVGSLVGLAGSPVPKMRTVALGTVEARIRGGETAPPELGSALRSALKDPIMNVVQAALDVTAAWTDQEKMLPDGLGPELAATVAARAAAGTLDASITRGVTNVFKIALRHAAPGPSPETAEWIRGLLRVMDTAQMNKTQANMMELVTALARRDAAFLPSLIEMFPTLPSKRTMYVIVRAIERVEGRASPLLAQLLALPDCPEEGKRLIVSFHRN
ncbi:MAG: hypothetical protein JWM27_2056 [Gemmatimonadetes bacterium]|nr:hypothetical protein [Gemmatimonadota bacterium]